jgi:hypothetical protein
MSFDALSWGQAEPPSGVTTAVTTAGPTVEVVATRLLCIRPTCSAPSEATLRYDYSARTAWLGAPEAERDPAVWPLCGHHADSLRVPEGWTLLDERPTSMLRYFPPLAG